MAPQARQMAADGHGRGLDCPDALVVSARLQPAVGVNNAPCNGQTEISQSVQIVLDTIFNVESGGVTRF